MSSKKSSPKKTKDWLEEEGKLVIDVIESDDYYLIQSAIAGIDAKKLEIIFKNNMLSIRGQRPRPEKKNGQYLLQECYWGPFSRQISLDESVDPAQIKASVQDGILTVKVPRIPKQKRKIEIK
jgi:HSP20 family protein